MQKDMHHNMTGFLAVLTGFTPEQAAEIAWGNQYTDDNTNPNEYGIATAVDYNLAEVFNKTIQLFRIVCFHALPGDNPNNKWIVTSNCQLVQNLLQNAIDKKDLIALAIALHALQDTFSHQSFTGWQDDVNANPSLNLMSFIIPRILHAEFLRFPDDVGAIWDRNGVQINNVMRAKEVCLHTFIWMRKFLEVPCTPKDLDNLMELLEPFWKIKNYDNRKKWLKDRSGLCSYSDYKETKEQREQFSSAARRQVSEVMRFVA